LAKRKKRGIFIGKKIKEMGRIQIDGQMVNFSFKHVNNSIAGIVTTFLETSTPFVLHDGDGKGPVFIPDRLACIDRGETLIHSGVNEFMFSLSFQIGLYSCASPLEVDAIIYFKNLLLRSNRPQSIIKID
jgi:hypothetical protein